MDKAQQKSINQASPKEPSRAYGCPCGKTYLSYPALFTHVKQKHDGKPPGNLIKPKSGKIRGRPKTRINPEEEELIEILNKIQHDIPQLLEGQNIVYEQEFERSQGNTTCQDAASNFLDHFENLSQNGLIILACFLNELKSAVDSKFGVDYWLKQKPFEMIQVANDLYIQHQQKQSTFPIGKQLFKELIYNYFEWLYANKYTDHRLLRSTTSEEGTKANQ